MIDLSICILTYNHCEMLSNCINSVYADTDNLNIEIIIVDSGSYDGTIEMLHNKYPEIKIIQNNKFSGFASGNNQAFNLTTGKFIVILNDDTIVCKGGLSKMYLYLIGNHKIGAIGPCLLNNDLTIQRSAYISYSTIFTDLFIHSIQIYIFYSFLQSKFKFNKKIDQFGFYKTNLDTQKVKHLMGACIMIRREVLELVGGLDENYYLSFEDQDWCKRISESGWDIVFFPKSKIIHFGNQTVKSFANFDKIYFQSRYYFQKKHYGIISLFLFKFFNIIISLNNLLLATLILPFNMNNIRKTWLKSVIKNSSKTLSWTLNH
jgi:GT2 family glycosyltransferase